MKNPTIEQLQNSGEYELIAELDHYHIKEFVIEQLSGGGKIVKAFMVYQLIMSLVGLLFVTRSIALALHGELTFLYVTIGSLIFCFTFLVILHELLHGLAVKLTGARKVNFGGYFSKFIFYAEADRHVLNRRQFVFLALTPLAVVKIISLAGAVLFLHHPVFYFFIITMSIHSLFCAGDIGLMTLFYKYNNQEVYTFDVKEERKAYFFRKVLH